MKKTVRITKKKAPAKKQKAPTLDKIDLQKIPVKGSEEEQFIMSDEIGTIDQNFINELKHIRGEWQALIQKFQNEGFIRQKEEPMSSEERFKLECADIAELRRRYLEDIFIKRYLPWWAKCIISIQKNVVFPIRRKLSKLKRKEKITHKEGVDVDPNLFEDGDKLNRSVAKQLITKYMESVKDHDVEVH
jgi:hypothetical protein